MQRNDFMTYNLLLLLCLFHWFKEHITRIILYFITTFSCRVCLKTISRKGLALVMLSQDGFNSSDG